MIFSAGYLALATRPGHSRRALRSNAIIPPFQIPERTYGRANMKRKERNEGNEEKKRKKPAR
jgi:hypothetical protein